MAIFLVPVNEVPFLETSIEYDTLNQAEIIQMEDDDGATEKWSDSEIKILLDSYVENVDKFRNSKMKKKDLWVQISRNIGKSPHNCDKKFRNLKQTYIKLLLKKHEGGKILKWRWFNAFENIFCVNGEYNEKIQQRLEEKSDSKAILGLASLKSTKLMDGLYENGESSANVQNEAIRRRRNRRNYLQFKKLAQEMRDRQNDVEDKLDKLISIVEESNSIQKERNRLFQLYLEGLNQENP